MWWHCYLVWMFLIWSLTIFVFLSTLNQRWHPFFGHFGHLQFEVAIYSDLNDKINNICKKSTPWYNFCHPSWSLMHVNMYFGYPCIHCLHMPFVYFPQRLLYHLAFILLTMSVHDEWYSWNASCSVNKISTFLFCFTLKSGLGYLVCRLYMQLYMIAILNKNSFPHWMDSVISFVVRIRFVAILTTFKIVVRIDTAFFNIWPKSGWICVFDTCSSSVDRSRRSLFLYWFLFSLFWPLLQIPVSREFLMINWFLFLFVLKWLEYAVARETYRSQSSAVIKRQSDIIVKEIKIQLY